MLSVSLCLLIPSLFSLITFASIRVTAHYQRQRSSHQVCKHQQCIWRETWGDAARGQSAFTQLQALLGPLAMANLPPAAPAAG